MKRAISIIAGILVLVLLGVAFGVGYGIAQDRAEADMVKLLSDLDTAYAELEVARNHETTLSKTLLAATDEREQLLATIAALKEAPADIRYVIKTKTVVEPAKPATVVTETLPAKHDFTLQDNLVVAQFEASDSGYSFRTHELSLRGTLAIGEDRSALVVEASTSADEEHWEEVPVALSVQKMRQHKPVEFHLGVGATFGGGASVLDQSPVPGMYGGLTTSFLHPKEDLDVLQLRVQTDGEALAIGIDPISFNLGEKLPVFTDLWLAPGGVTIDTAGKLTVGVTVSSKF